MCFPPLFGPHVCLPSFCGRALSFSSSLYAQVSLFLSLFLSFFLSFSFSVCCLSRHHCDVTVTLRCDVISSPLFWFPCVSHLFLHCGLRHAPLKSRTWLNSACSAFDCDPRHHRAPPSIAAAGFCRSREMAVLRFAGVPLVSWVFPDPTFRPTLSALLLHRSRHDS